MKIKTGLTLAELLIVVVVIGILASIALTQYSRTVQIARVREAESALRLIQGGQKVYWSRNNDYYASDVIGNINDNLALDLEESYWDYQALDPGAVNGTVGRADTATGTGLRIDNTGDACCDAGPCYEVPGC